MLSVSAAKQIVKSKSENDGRRVCMKLKNKFAARTAMLIGASIIFSGCKKQSHAPQPAAPEQREAAAPAQPTPAGPAGTKPAPATATAASKAAAPAHDYIKELQSPAKLKEKAPETYKVKFDTTRGEFTITVTRAWAPLEADRFTTW